METVKMKVVEKGEEKERKRQLNESRFKEIIIIILKKMK